MTIETGEIDSQIDELFTHLDNSCVALPDFGCYVALSEDKDSIFQCVMLVDGTPERAEDDARHMNWGEVTAPEREFVHKVNELFGTALDYEKFPGR